MNKNYEVFNQMETKECWEYEMTSEEKEAHLSAFHAKKKKNRTWKGIVKVACAFVCIGVMGAGVTAATTGENPIHFWKNAIFSDGDRVRSNTFSQENEHNVQYALDENGFVNVFVELKDAKTEQQVREAAKNTKVVVMRHGSNVSFEPQNLEIKKIVVDDTLGKDNQPCGIAISCYAPELLNGDSLKVICEGEKYQRDSFAVTQKGLKSWQNGKETVTLSAFGICVEGKGEFMDKMGEMLLRSDYPRYVLRERNGARKDVQLSCFMGTEEDKCILQFSPYYVYDKAMSGKVWTQKEYDELRESFINEVIDVDHFASLETEEGKILLEK